MTLASSLNFLKCLHKVDIYVFLVKMSQKPLDAVAMKFATDVHVSLENDL